MPFSSVDIIIFFQDNNILLTKRTVRPYFGYWHLPGSMILKKETMTETANRCASEELNIEIDDLEFLGIYELFTDARHYITHTFSARYKRGTIKLDHQSSKFVFADIKDLPEPIIPIQKQMIKDLLKKKKMIG